MRTKIAVSTIGLLITLAGCGGGETATTTTGGHGGEATTGSSAGGAGGASGTNATGSATGTGGNAMTSTGSQNPGAAPFGAPCAKNGDCAALLCVDTDATHSVCTKPCDAVAVCPPGPEWSCAMKGGTPQTICLCQPSGPEICDGEDNNCDGVVDEGDCPELFGSASGPIVDLKLASDRLVLLTDKTIETLDLAGGMPLVTLRSDIVNVNAVALNAGYIFWIQGKLHQMGFNGLAGADQKVQGSAPYSDIVADIANQYYRDPSQVWRALPYNKFVDAPSPGPMLLFKNVVYWGAGSTLYRCDTINLDNNLRVSMATGLIGPVSFATNGTTLYWADASGTIHGAAPPGYMVGNILSGEPGIIGLAADAINIYWVTSDSLTSKIWKAPLAGGAKTKIGGVTGKALHLVSTGNYVYYETGKLIWRSPT